ncbi:uncharacterized protein [Cicer arietinum]|uniref:Dynein light chain n=1 Tax=Cicer arietinum TaxID=3827 RepID=A0A1S2XGV1_CICAR|nr:dynein light chain 2, cytoplasmic-like [Cicer arietinum]
MGRRKKKSIPHIALRMRATNSPKNQSNKIFIVSTDMTRSMQIETSDISTTVFNKNHNLDRVTAEEIKIEFDNRYGPTWHCIVGRNFGSHVPHEVKHYIHFFFKDKAVLLYKFG